MKVVEKGELDQEDFNYLKNYANEKIKRNALGVSENGNLFRYKKSDKQEKQYLISNFFIVTKGTYPIKNENNILRYNYAIKIITGDMKYVNIMIDETELINSKWISIASPLFIIESPKGENYDYIKKTINIVKKESIDEKKYFEDIGWYEIGNQWYYTHSKGMIGKNGDCSKKGQSILENFDLNYTVTDDFKTEKETFEELLKALNIGDKNSILPIFTFTLLSLIVTPLMKKGNSPEFTMWLEGISGSGKTELAVLFTSIFNRSNYVNKSYNRKNIKLVRDKLSEVLDTYYQHKDSVFILDDYHPNVSTIEKEKMKMNISHITRESGNRPIKIKDGKEYYSKCLTIVTGEQLLDTVKSLNARSLYVKMDKFFKNPESSKKLKYFQINNIFLSNFIYFYLKWLAQKLEEDLVDRINSDLDKYRIDNFNEQHARINDTFYYLKIAYDLFLSYGFDKRFITYTEKEEMSTDASEIFYTITSEQNYLVADDISIFLKKLEYLIRNRFIKIKMVDINVCKRNEIINLENHPIDESQSEVGILSFVKRDNEFIYLNLAIINHFLYAMINEIHLFGKAPRHLMMKTFQMKKTNKLLKEKGFIQSFPRTDKSGRVNNTRPINFLNRDGELDQAGAVYFNVYMKEFEGIIDAINNENKHKYY